MSSKKSRKSSCPFASANRADVLATTVIKSKIDVRTIPLVLAGRKLKAKAKTNPQNLLKSVSCRFCHADVTSLENVSARSGLRSCWIGSCQNKKIACRGLCIFLITSSLALSPFEVVTSCSMSARVEGFPCLRKRFFLVFGTSQAVSLESQNVNPH